MTVFVHVQTTKALTQAQVEQTWGAPPSQAKAVGASDLVVLSLNVFNAQGEPAAAFAAHSGAVLAALKSVFEAETVAELGPWEYEFVSHGELVNATLRKQGLVLTLKNGTVAAANWPAAMTPAALTETVRVASATLDAAQRVDPTKKTEVWS